MKLYSSNKLYLNESEAPATLVIDGASADTERMDTSCNLTNQFLIAMPSMADPNFYQTVTYICEHNSDGALGIVINRPLELSLSDLVAQLDIKNDAQIIADEPVFAGGPVQTERGLVLHKPITEWESTMRVTDQIGLTSSRDILEAIAVGLGPAKHLFVLGYAGWGAGQLEQEMLDNTWLSGPADDKVLFDTPVDLRWNRAAALLGVDLNLISSQAGHA